MMITRQHGETEISELAGTVCHATLAAGVSIEEGITALFLQAGDVWYRVYIDMGVLFWQSGMPDPEIELSEDEKFIDLFRYIGASALRIEHIRMHSGKLHIKFAGPHSIILAEQEECGLLDVQVH